MKRTISIKLSVAEDQQHSLEKTQKEFSNACNLIVPFVVDNRTWNRVALHHLCYYKIREESSLGSQMVCNAIAKVSQAYKAKPPKKGEKAKTISFTHGSIHYDKRTYSIKTDVLSIWTVDGRIKVKMIYGKHQLSYLKDGIPKEAELINKKGTWFFNLVLDIETPKSRPGNDVLGIDVGENITAATSSGLLIDGGKIRHDRDKFLALRRRLQRKGTRSARQLLRNISGREKRHIKHVNHEVSKKLVLEAVRVKASTIAMEDLTHIRKNIKARKRVRSRLHRWAWRQLQTFVEYKGEKVGIKSVYSEPAYSSQLCSNCGAFGKRKKHLFSCQACESKRHADANAASNHRKLAMAIATATGVSNTSECTMCN